MLEHQVYKNKELVKILRMFDEKNKIIVQELELRKRFVEEKGQFIPVYMDTFDKIEVARIVFLGRLSMLGYENGNPTTAPFGGIFRNSLSGS